MKAFPILIEWIGVVGDEVRKPLRAGFVEMFRVPFDLLDLDASRARSLLPCPSVLLRVLCDGPITAEELSDPLDCDSPLPALLTLSGFLIV